MASDKNYLEFVLEQLSLLDEISYKAMMGEYLLYYRNKLFGGIYDDRFLVKNIESAKKLIENPVYEIPYETAKPMIMVEQIEDKIFLSELIKAMYDDLPVAKPKSKKI